MEGWRLVMLIELTERPLGVGVGWDGVVVIRVELAEVKIVGAWIG